MVDFRDVAARFVLVVIASPMPASATDTQSQATPCFEIVMENPTVSVPQVILPNKCTGASWVLDRMPLGDANGRPTQTFIVTGILLEIGGILRGGKVPLRAREELAWLSLAGFGSVKTPIPWRMRWW